MGQGGGAVERAGWSEGEEECNVESVGRSGSRRGKGSGMWVGMSVVMTFALDILHVIMQGVGVVVWTL